MSKTRHDHIINDDNEKGIPTILLKKEYFEQTSVMKTIRIFSRDILCEMLPEGEDYVKVSFLKSKNESIDIKEIPYKFYNAVIDQQIREDLLKSSMEIQKTIYSTAFMPISELVNRQ